MVSAFLPTVPRMTRSTESANACNEEGIGGEVDHRQRRNRLVLQASGGNSGMQPDGYCDWRHYLKDRLAGSHASPPLVHLSD